MEFFNRAFMNGATLFGVSLTLFTLFFALSSKLGYLSQIFLVFVAFLYLITSFFAFVFPSLSGVKKITEETSFRRLKKALLELLRGYPEYIFYGKIEYFVKTRKEAVYLLDKHKIIEKIPKEDVKKYIGRMAIEERQKLMQLPEEDRFRWYRLRPRGVDLAISMINLEHSERVSKYSKQMKCFTITIIVIGTLTLSLSLWALLHSYALI